MTKKYKYKIVSDAFTFEVKDSVIGWEDKKIIFARDDFHGVNIDFADNVSFSGKTRENILYNFTQYGISNEVFLECYAKDNISQSYSLFKKYRLDFSTLENKINGDEANRCTIGLIDSGIRPIIEARKDQKYSIDIESDGQRTLTYDGVNLVSNTEIQLGAGDLTPYKTTTDNAKSYYHIPAKLGVTSFNANLSFINEDFSSTNSFSIRVLKDTKLNLNLYIKDLYIYMSQVVSEPYEGKIYLMRKKADGSQSPIRMTVNGVSQSFLSPTEQERGSAWAWLQLVNPFLFMAYTLCAKFIYENPITVSANVYEGETIELVYFGASGNLIIDGLAWSIKPTVLGQYPYNDADGISVGSETYIGISNYTQSQYYGADIKLTTHEHLLKKVLMKILETETEDDFTLEYKIIHENFTHLICGSDAFRLGVDNPKMNISLTDILKDLYCNYGAFYEIDGNTFTVDISKNAYLNEKSPINLKNINNLGWKVDISHIYTSLSVGYSTSDADKENGRYAFCCENKFTTPMKAIDSKEFDLKSPFIADCYSIEDALTKAKKESDKDKSTDENIFSFACIEENGKYVLCRTYAKDVNGDSIISGGFDLETIYNLPISPKRMIVTNLGYISISAYGVDEQFKFTSSDKNADVFSQMAWENEKIYENSDFSKINYLFLPMIISFDCSEDWDNLLNIPKHAYYQVNNMTGWINKLELSAGFNTQQSIELMARTI